MKIENIKMILISIVLSLMLSGFSTMVSQDTGTNHLKDNIFDISVADMENNEIQLSDYRGKVLLIVNVASECGYTDQYKGLEEIYRKYNRLGFEILAFPCNDFGGQEPGTNDEIKAFCSSNYNVTFKLLDKVKVLGIDKSPLYERLTNNSITGQSDINWNFEKFIISKDGKIIARFLSKVDPGDDAITMLIEEELAK